MKKFQKEIDKFAQRFNPPYWTPHEILARLIEEVGELARELNFVYGPKKKKKNEKDKKIEDELGDIIFTIVCLANSLNIDLDETLKRTIDKSWNRDKNRYNRKK